jgi:16S rRNA (cytidine1402-2'-O)-methyltransferase
VLAAAAAEPRTLVFFESPHRLRAALEDVAEVFGDRPLAICRELTKVFEEVFRGTAAAALGHFMSPRGEFTIVLAPPEDSQQPDEEAAITELHRLKRAGVRAAEASAEVARRTGVPRRRLYETWRSLDS